MDVKTTIRNGDADGLRQLLAEDSSRANALVRWGINDCVLTHPLHYVSDVLFEGKLERGKELALVEVLIQAGADLDFQRNKNGKSDTPLIGAASLGAEEVGLSLLDAGARPEVRGMFGETALHWAALLGEDRLAGRLIEGGRLEPQGREIQLAALGMGDPRLVRATCWEPRPTSPTFSRPGLRVRLWYRLLYSLK